jgi:hypothetical protein
VADAESLRSGLNSDLSVDKEPILSDYSSRLGVRRVSRVPLREHSTAFARRWGRNGAVVVPV